MKKLILPLLLVLFVTGFVSAQRTVTGTITNDDGEPLIGASVLVKGTTVGTVADFDGTYTLDVPDGSNTLVFSFTGYQQQEIELGTSNVVDLVLSEGVELGEVVVTGLGIKREKKALGYGVSTIASGDIAGRQEADVARILRGKATGVDITQTSGLAGSGTNVIIRGYSSITGNNQPLFIVDGIPFNSETNTNSGFGAGGAAASSRFLDLDPNAIAEVSILKGLSATVLYGEAGRNGVILITTKNGNAGVDANKGLEVSVTQALSFSEVANLPDYQNTFGNGFNAGFGWFFSNWGAAFADLKPSSYGSDYKGEKNGQVLITHPYDQAQYHDDFPEYIGAEYPYQPFSSVEEFLGDPGMTANTSVSIESKLGANASVSATYSYLNDEGFTPKLDEERGGGASNFLKKHNLGLGARTKLANGLEIQGTFNFVASDRRTPITSTAFGGAGNGLFAAVLFTPRSMDLMGLPYQSPIDGSNVYYRRGSPIQNPRWILNNGADVDNTLRFFSTLKLGYELTDNIRFQYQLGIDQYSLKQTRTQNRGGANNPDGFMNTSNRLSRISDQLFNVLYQFELTPDFSLDGILGFNIRREVQEGFIDVASQQFVYGLFTTQNFINHQSFSGFAEENTLGAYATATLGYKNYAYLNLQVRNDWTSTLEEANRSVLYPSVSLSFVPTDAIPSLQNSTVLNYLKIRLGYGTSAGYPNPYQTRNVLNTYTNGFVAADGTILNGNQVSGRLGNGNLMRELHTEIEGGIEARFLRNRIGVDLSLYNRNSSDLIIDLNLDPATGFNNTTVNAAELENKGVELGLNITPFQGDFQWDITLNYTKNVSEVLAIAEGIDQIQIRSEGDVLTGDGAAGFNGGLGNYAIVGQPYGIMQGSSFIRDDAGNLVVDGQGAYQAASGLGIIGDPNNNFQANWINNFSYKGLSFGFQWQYIDGGDIYSSTVQALLARGNTVDTDVDRFVPVIMPGVKADGTPNDIQTYIGDTFFRAYFFANEGGVFDATTIRLREVSLAYVLPSKLLERTPFGRAGITISGENLWYNAPNFPKGINFDPEVLSLGVGNGRGFDFRTAPTVKKYGVNLSLTF
ncbi:MAG: SusC/RagA family TonB-linked outer membrane protein [Saprospiraceae bacterium]|nr:SusC/RagA family TonB-linked outer membrane protein [Saprospiraceae bacterium]